MKSMLAHKVAALAATATLLAVPATALPAAASAVPSPRPLKACSAYDKEHFHGVTAHLPDGTKCLQVGEYCSHAPGFARAYREYGFYCDSEGRLEDS